MGKLSHILDLTEELSLDEQERLRITWNQRVDNTRAFIPHELREQISEEEAEEANQNYGQFACRYLKEAFLRKSTVSDRFRRLNESKKLVDVGLGRKYDLNFFREATEVGLEVWGIDVSDKACMWAMENFASQRLELLQKGFEYPKAVIKNVEVRTALQNPQSIDLDLDSVEGWYLSRTLGCLSELTARIVLQKMGGSLRAEVDQEKKNAIVLIVALKDYNKNRVACTSSLYSLRMIKSCITSGAERKIAVRNECSYRYFTQVYTAITLMAE